MLRCIKPFIFRPRLVIPQMRFEVCTVCNNKCMYCAHQHAMDDFPRYQMSIEQVKEFIKATKESGYWIKELYIHGLGEPTLWKNFNEGVQLLGRSGCIGRIFVTTNGANIQRIAPETWRHIYAMFFSVYAQTGRKIADALKAERKGQIILSDMQTFRPFVVKRYPGTLPANCGCPGPMYCDGKVYFYCGPSGWQPSVLLGESQEYSVVKRDYMSAYKSGVTGNMTRCEYCFVNFKIDLESKPHTFVP